MPVVLPDLLNELDVRTALGAGGKPISKSSLQRRLTDCPDFPKPFTIGRNRRWFAR